MVILPRRDDFEDGEDRRLPRNFRGQTLDRSKFKAATMDTAIPADNRGYRLLQAMGWKAGNGLGKNQQGIIDPVRLDCNEFKLGLGKDSEYNYYATEATKERLTLDSEIDENVVRQRRVGEAERAEKITAEKKKVTKKFYCEICDAQYQTALQWEEHLCSYNHGHKKRFLEMKAMMKGRDEGPSAEEREQEAAQKEMRKAMKQAQKVAQQAQQRAATQPPPPPPPPPVEDTHVESLDSGKRTAVKLAMGGMKKTKLGGGMAKKKSKPMGMTFDLANDGE